MTSVFPTAVTYGTIKGTLVQAVVDAIDADTHPDSLPLQGTVIITPGVNTLSAPTIGETIVLSPIKVNLSATGAFAVEVISTNNAAISPVGWKWTVSFNLVGADISPISISVPASSTVDISSVAASGGGISSSVGTNAPNLYVQAANPNMTSPGVWFQTGLNADKKGITIWVEDGS